MQKHLIRDDVSFDNIRGRYFKWSKAIESLFISNYVSHQKDPKDGL
jgi:hypothetical protein